MSAHPLQVEQLACGLTLYGGVAVVASRFHFVKCTFALNDGGKKEKTHQSVFLKKSSPEKKGEAQRKCSSQLKI